MKLSIIIPVYNVQNYIKECLDSIISQSFKDYEIICVNDGSSDNSLQILKQYENDNVIVIDKPNEGSGIARNTGLEKATGEYIWFVDGDDWIEKNVLSELINQADILNTDILIFGGQSCYKTDTGYKKKSGGYSADKLPKKYLKQVFSSDDIKYDLFKFPSTAWTKLYRRSFLIDNNIKFQNIKIGQDQLPFFHSMISADRIALYPKNIYCYRKNRTGSAMTVKKKKNFSPVYVFYAIEDLLNNSGKMKNYEYIFVDKYFSKATSWLGKFDTELKLEYYSEYRKLHEHIVTHYEGWWKYFKPNINDSYMILKIKRFISIIKWKSAICNQ